MSSRLVLAVGVQKSELALPGEKDCADEHAAMMATGTDDDADWDDDDDDIMPRAFHVSGQPDLNSGPPATAEEYLRRVRWEASQCSQTVVSAIDPRSFDNAQTKYVPRVQHAVECKAELLPSPDWQDRFAASFADLRQAMYRHHARGSIHSHQRLQQIGAHSDIKLPGRKDRSGWLVFCVGAQEAAVVTAGTDSVMTTADADGNEADPPGTQSTAAHMLDGGGGDEDEVDDEDTVDDDAGGGHALDQPAPSRLAISDAGARSVQHADPLIITAAGQHAAGAGLGLHPMDTDESSVQADDRDRAPAALDPPISLASSIHASSTGPHPVTAAATSTASAGSEETGSHVPLLSVVLRLDQVCTRTVLEVLIEHVQQTPALSSAAAMWLFALLAWLDKPLHSDMQAHLRDLYRRLAWLRAQLHAEPSSPVVAYHNILLTIIDRCFGQKA